MKAIQIVEAGRIELVERPRPEPAEGEALVQVRAVGYCGTDLGTYRGSNPLVNYPRIPGHEVAATIAELGPNTKTDLAIGQDVLVFPYTRCGGCSACRVGRPNCCQHNQTLGVQREGVLAEWAALPVGTLIAAPGLGHRELALVEPLTVGAHAAARGGVSSSDTVLVFGCGAIGIGVIAAAAAHGAQVIAVDIDGEKIELASLCGAQQTVNAQSEDLTQRVRELTDGHGPSVVIEAVGSPQTFRAAVDLVAFAGRVVYVGYAKAAVEYETKWFVMKELDIRGSRNALREDFEAVIHTLQSGVLPVDKIISKTVGIDDACDAMREWNDQPQRITKIQVAVS